MKKVLKLLLINAILITGLVFIGVGELEFSYKGFCLFLGSIVIVCPAYSWYDKKLKL